MDEFKQGESVRHGRPGGGIIEDASHVRARRGVRVRTSGGQFRQETALVGGFDLAEAMELAYVESDTQSARYSGRRSSSCQLSMYARPDGS